MQDQDQDIHYVVYVQGRYITHRKEKEEAIELAETYVKIGANNVWISEEWRKIIWKDGKEI